MKHFEITCMVVCLLVVLCFVVVMAIPTISKSDVTRTHMSIIENEINTLITKGAAPTDISYVIREKTYLSPVVLDGWKTQMEVNIMSFNSEFVIEIRSAGPNLRLGDGDDILHSANFRRSDRTKE